MHITVKELLHNQDYRWEFTPEIIAYYGYGQLYYRKTAQWVIKRKWDDFTTGFMFMARWIKPNALYIIHGPAAPDGLRDMDFIELFSRYPEANFWEVTSNKHLRTQKQKAFA